MTVGEHDIHLKQIVDGEAMLAGEVTVVAKTPVSLKLARQVT